MGMQNPKVSKSENFTDHYEEGQRFYLEGIRTVEVNTADYGKGEMVLLTVKGHENELGIWGAYLATQANSASIDDFPKWYTVTRKVVAGSASGPSKSSNPPKRPDKSTMPRRSKTTPRT